MRRDLFSNYWSWKVWSIGAIVSICLALLLYLPKYGLVPAGLNRDEAALGYNAYSLLKTGKDEWGKSWPISLTSFGDQKLPGYVYSLIPLIAIFGLETWVVRLPSLLAGLIVILSGGLIATQLTKLAKYEKRTQVAISWVAMLLIAISPWSMHFSRVAYETHLAMAFFMSSLACLLFALDTKRKLLQRSLLSAAGLLAGLTLLTYHSYQIFIPLFLLSFLLIFFKQIKKLDKVGLMISVLLGLSSLGLLVSGGILAANKIKSQAISPFNEDALLTQVTEYRNASHLPTIINKILFNKIDEGLIAFAKNYVSTFSGTFFFVHGSNHGDHNPGNGNNLNLFLAPFILLGIIVIGKKRKEPAFQLLAAWLLLALIPSSFTTNPLLEVRLATVFPALNLLATIGMFFLFSHLSKRGKIIFGSLLVALACLSALRLFIFYLHIAPKHAVDNSNYHSLARTLFKYQSISDIVLTQSPSSSPYIWYLFENKIDPALAQKELVHYPITDEGFVHVQNFENVYFSSIDWGNLAEGSYTLILKPSEISVDKRTNSQFEQLETITDKNGQTVYEVWKYNN